MAMNMRRSRFLACVLLALMLTSCATAPPSRGHYSSSGTSGGATQYTVMASILNVLALPLYIPFKLAVCATTIALAAPATAITAVTDPDGTGWQREMIAEGFTENCGLPWLP